MDIVAPTTSLDFDTKGNAKVTTKLDAMFPVCSLHNVGFREHVFIEEKAVG